MATGGDAEHLVREYVRGWIEADADAVVATLAPDCVVIESYGPTYRGRDCVRQWMSAWSGRGGRIDDWDLTSLHATQDTAFVEWTFRCWWQGQRYVLDGASLARCSHEGIIYLREYQTTADLYNWTGTWRE